MGAGLCAAGRFGNSAGAAAESHRGRLSVDKLVGEVTFVSRQAEFTPSNVQTFEERAKQMFRIKVTLQTTVGDEIQLRPGMTADVWLNGK